MTCKTEPQVGKYGPDQAAASEAMLRREADQYTFSPDEVDRPSIAPMVNQGSSIVPSQVNSGNLPPKVDR